MKPPLCQPREHADGYGWDLFDSEGTRIAEYIYLPDERAYIIAAVNACHRLGLTAEQLEAGVLEKLVEALRKSRQLPLMGIRLRNLLLGGYKEDADALDVEIYKIKDEIVSALAPFTK